MTAIGNNGPPPPLTPPPTVPITPGTGTLPPPPGPIISMEMLKFLVAEIAKNNQPAIVASKPPSKLSPYEKWKNLELKTQAEMLEENEFSLTGDVEQLARESADI